MEEDRKGLGHDSAGMEETEHDDGGSLQVGVTNRSTKYMNNINHLTLPLSSQMKDIMEDWEEEEDDWEEPAEPLYQTDMMENGQGATKDVTEEVTMTANPIQPPTTSTTTEPITVCQTADKTWGLTERTLTAHTQQTRDRQVQIKTNTVTHTHNDIYTNPLYYRPLQGNLRDKVKEWGEQDVIDAFNAGLAQRALQNTERSQQIKTQAKVAIRYIRYKDSTKKLKQTHPPSFIFAQKLLTQSIAQEEETNLALAEEELRRAEEAKRRADLEKKTASLRARTKAITEQLAKDKEMTESIALEKLRKDKKVADEKMKELLERQKQNYRLIKYFICDNENINNKSIIISFN
jgi:hypothetical protein